MFDRIHKRIWQRNCDRGNWKIIKFTQANGNIWFQVKKRNLLGLWKWATYSPGMDTVCPHTFDTKKEADSFIDEQMVWNANRISSLVKKVEEV